MHVEAPAAEEELAGHIRHTVEPATIAKVPVLHTTQAEALPLEEYEPAPQLVQNPDEVAPIAEE